MAHQRVPARAHGRELAQARVQGVQIARREPAGDIRRRERLELLEVAPALRLLLEREPGRVPPLAAPAPRRALERRRRGFRVEVLEAKPLRLRVRGEVLLAERLDALPPRRRRAQHGPRQRERLAQRGPVPVGELEFERSQRPAGLPVVRRRAITARPVPHRQREGSDRLDPRPRHPALLVRPPGDAQDHLRLAQRHLARAHRRVEQRALAEARREPRQPARGGLRQAQPLARVVAQARVAQAQRAAARLERTQPVAQGNVERARAPGHARQQPVDQLRRLRSEDEPPLARPRDLQLPRPHRERLQPVRAVKLLVLLANVRVHGPRRSTRL